MKYQSLRGTHDILPEETPVWQAVEAAAHDVFQSYGFREIRTPVFEQTDLFSRSIGEATDIVSKEMYTFTDRGDRSLALRPEGTAGVVRAAIENHLIVKDRTVKLYYIGPMFRYERPQAGRQRQFHQIGVEVLGSDAPQSDAEVMLVTISLFKKLGLADLKIDLNSVGCENCRPGYINELRNYLKKNQQDLCDDCRKRTEKNALRVLDCKAKGCQEIIEASPAISDFICNDCKDHLQTIKDILHFHKVPNVVNNKLVRGLDYYSKTTFEIVSSELGAQSAVCGGGRYDGLVEQLGGKPTPAVGMAVGIERLMLILKAKKLHNTGKNRKQIYFAAIGMDAINLSSKKIEELRKTGRVVETDYMIKNLSSHLKTADRIGAELVVIIGDEEIKKGAFQLRDMKTGAQKEIKQEELLKELESTC
jgi:histidyl-tRNA synthetase